MKTNILIFMALLMGSLTLHAQHNQGNNGKILLIASNPAVSEQTGWPIGVWAAEIVHPYWEFVNAGYSVDIASPNGGEVKIDNFSNPEDDSKYAAWDILSLGFLKDPAHANLLKNTIKLSTINKNDYKAIMVCGGQGPMYTFVGNKELQQFFADFYQTGKPAAAICHGTVILLKTKVNGKLLVEGKKWTGFSNDEENYADAYVGKKIQPFRIEDEAKKITTSKFVVAPMFTPFAVEDGNLITGQQQNSGAEAAKLIVKQLEKNKSKYPTYVLVHGAWADESAWGFIRNDLAKNANVIVVNLPAHGASNMNGASVGLNDYVKTVSNVINNQTGKVILVGHSMAGQVISQVAENLPNKVEKLIYVAAYLPRNGESVTGITNKFLNNKPIDIFQFNSDYSLVSIKKEAISNVVCADCSEDMKAALVKYHRPEPTKGLNDKVKLTAKFNTVPKYYIATTNDNAVPYALQQQMIKDNGTVKKVYQMNTSHLPFVVDPKTFLTILTSIK